MLKDRPGWVPLRSDVSVFALCAGGQAALHDLQLKAQHTYEGELLINPHCLALSNPSSGLPGYYRLHGRVECIGLASSERDQKANNEPVFPSFSLAV